MTPVRAQIEASFIAACQAELRALKPGNVHDFAPGHRMAVADFELSARLSAPFIAETGAPVGKRVLGAMRATMVAVGQNTNLGILLLSAPLALAYERWRAAGSGAFRDHLGEVLDEASVEDAEDVFAAIRLASPGGLGSAETADVAEPATLTLTATMALAADRDRIARQYVTIFADIFDPGLAVHRRCLMSQMGQSRITTAIYFAFASRFPDTHIARKFGPARAEEIRQLFAESQEKFASFDEVALLEFDARLKAASINPGTSADLTVATVFAGLLTD